MLTKLNFRLKYKIATNIYHVPQYKRRLLDTRVVSVRQGHRLLGPLPSVTVLYRSPPSSPPRSPRWSAYLLLLPVPMAPLGTVSKQVTGMRDIDRYWFIPTSWSRVHALVLHARTLLLLKLSLPLVFPTILPCWANFPSCISLDLMVTIPNYG